MAVTRTRTGLQSHHTSGTAHQHVIEVDLITDDVAGVQRQVDAVQSTPENGGLGLLDVLDLFSQASPDMPVRHD